MEHNISPTASPRTGPDKPTGPRLEEVTDVGFLQETVRKLWVLLDDIDTLTDILKPLDSKGYQQFYNATMKRVQKRFETIESDGYELYRRNNT